jgi:hypothetical protein
LLPTFDLSHQLSWQLGRRMAEVAADKYSSDEGNSSHHSSGSSSNVVAVTRE